MLAVKDKSGAAGTSLPPPLPLENGDCIEDDDYRSQAPDPEGLLHSRVFPGLRPPVASLLAGDVAKVLDALADPASH